MSSENKPASQKDQEYSMQFIITFSFTQKKETSPLSSLFLEKECRLCVLFHRRKRFSEWFIDFEMKVVRRKAVSFDMQQSTCTQLDMQEWMFSQ